MQSLGFLGALCAFACLPSPLWATIAQDPAHRKEASVRYEAAIDQTFVTARISRDECLAFSLPDDWRNEPEIGEALRLAASDGEGEIDISFRRLRHIADRLPADPLQQDAVLLQRDHEDLLGRPVQAVELSALPGAVRFTATWIDSSLPSPQHAFTVETYIIKASRDVVMELSVSDMGGRQGRDQLVAKVIAALRTIHAPECVGAD